MQSQHAETTLGETGTDGGSFRALRDLRWMPDSRRDYDDRQRVSPAAQSVETRLARTFPLYLLGEFLRCEMTTSSALCLFDNAK